MDIEWAKDGRTGELFIVRARPETVHSRPGAAMVRMFKRERPGHAIATGLAIGDAIASGHARVVLDPSRESEIQKGDVLVTEVTDPDWEPIMKVAAAPRTPPSSALATRPRR